MLFGLVFGSLACSRVPLGELSTKDYGIAVPLSTKQDTILSVTICFHFVSILTQWVYSVIITHCKNQVDLAWLNTCLHGNIVEK